MALYAHGIDEEPFSFASASPLGISFLWSASNIDVLSLVSVYEKVCWLSRVIEFTKVLVVM